MAVTVGLETDFAVIVAVPTLTAVTLPNDETVATLASLVSQVTFVLEAFSGKAVAVNDSLFPASSERVVLLRVILVTATSVWPPLVGLLVSEVVGLADWLPL